MVVGNPRPGGRVDRAIDRLGLRGIVRCVSGISDEELARAYGEAEVAVVPLALRGLLPAGHRGHGLRGAGGGHHRRAPCPRWWDATARPGCWCPPTTPGPWPRPSPASSTTRPCGRRLGAAGRERVLNRFTWQVTAKGTAECYQAVMDGRPLPGAPAAGPPAGAPRRHRGDRARADRRLRPTGGGAGGPPARPGLRVRPPRLRGRPARARRWWPSTPGRTEVDGVGPPSGPWSRPASSTGPRPGPGPSRATPCGCPSPTAPSTG